MDGKDEHPGEPHPAGKQGSAEPAALGDRQFGGKLQLRHWLVLGTTNGWVPNLLTAFALGSIAYEMMCGQPTFADESGHVGVQSTLEREPPPLRSRVEVSEAIAQAIHRSLAKDLELRYPNV
jgi:hypothetical protein